MDYSIGGTYITYITLFHRVRVRSMRPGDGAVRLNHPSNFFLVSIFYITDPTTRRAKRYAILHATSENISLSLLTNCDDDP